MKVTPAEYTHPIHLAWSPDVEAANRALVRRGEQTVRALTECAEISQPTVPKKLVVLNAAGLVAGEQRGFRRDQKQVLGEAKVPGQYSLTISRIPHGQL